MHLSYSHVLQPWIRLYYCSPTDRPDLKWLTGWQFGSGVGTSWKVGRLNSERLPSPAAKRPPSTQLWGLGERCKLPQWGLGQSPRKFRIWCKFWIWCILRHLVASILCKHQFLPHDAMRNCGLCYCTVSSFLQAGCPSCRFSAQLIQFTQWYAKTVSPVFMCSYPGHNLL